MSKQRARLRIDPDYVNETNAPNDFAKDWASGPATDDRVRRIAGLLGRQAARDLLHQAANENEPVQPTPNAEPRS